MDPDTSNDKENNESGSQKSKANRRDSLGRGILKNLNRHDDNNTIAVMQLPLRDSQNQLNINQGKSSYRRRVSFAPEVTLHKIELVPHSSTEQRQPKRRETIAFAPSSSRSQSPVHGSHPIIGEKRKHQEVEEEEDNGLMYDSSDVEMEDDSHVYSSPNKITTGPRFEIHNDGDSDNMSLTENFEESDGENTMDLTKPLGNIQQMMLQESSNPLGLSNQHLKDTPETASRPFGSITSIFGSEAASEDDHEQEMELTQPFSKVIISNKEKEAVEAHDSKEYDVTMEETTMDLTSIAEGSTDKITMHNTQINRGADGASSNKTQPLASTDEDTALNDDTEVSMDVTKLMPINNTPPEVHKASTTDDLKKAKHTTPLKPSRSHTSETGSPMSSKGKNKQDDTISFNLRERINSLTPKKKRKSLNKQQVSSQEKKLDLFFPLVSAHHSSQEEPKSSFTPLRSSKGSSRKSVIGTDLINFALESIEKAPLAPSHDENVTNTEEYIPVSLKQFLSDLSIEFFDNLNINDDLTVSFSEQFDITGIHTFDYLKGKMSLIPWLELYMFSCTELQKNMTELKRLFDNLNEEFSEENPPLVREYYQSTNIQQQKKMSDHLLFMKTLSDKQAETSWLTWRNQLLEELVSRLDTNLRTLKEESTNLSSVLEEVTNLEKTIDEEFFSIDNQLQGYLKQNEVAEASSSEDVTSLRHELLEFLDTSLSQQKVFDDLEIQVQESSDKLKDSKDLEKEVNQKLEFIETNGRDPLSRLEHLKKSFLTIQSISGLKFHQLAGTIVTVGLCDGLVELKVDLSDSEAKPLDHILSKELPTLTQFYLTRYLSSPQSLSIGQQLTKIGKIIQSLNWLDDQLYFIGLVSPVKLIMGDTLDIVVKETNNVEGYKVFIKLKLTEKSLYGNLNPDYITANVVYGPQGLDGDILLDNWKSKTTNNSWIQKFDTLTLIHS